MRDLHASCPQDFEEGENVYYFGFNFCVDGAAPPDPDKEDLQGKQPTDRHHVADMTATMRNLSGGQSRYACPQHREQRKHAQIGYQENARLPLEARYQIWHEIEKNDQQIVDHFERY